MAGVRVESGGIQSFRRAPDDWITEYVNSQCEQPKRNDKDSPRGTIRAVLVRDGDRLVFLDRPFYGEGNSLYS